MCDFPLALSDFLSASSYFPQALSDFLFPPLDFLLIQGVHDLASSTPSDFLSAPSVSLQSSSLLLTSLQKPIIIYISIINQCIIYAIACLSPFISSFSNSILKSPISTFVFLAIVMQRKRPI